ncbi:hypothetical protein [Streptomyces sp. RFCAC02]|uniref:hypothetical protein n=1 Tax=Streptomyces sp. RFCAC02 TaxID=2499143 RepID=UPI00143D02AA|nr:hypothetical protein [Streptomyces sp. RFCAC02]
MATTTTSTTSTAAGREAALLRDALVVPVRMSLGWPAARSSDELVAAVRGTRR